jgi:uncharacterized membrane protein YoaK (UPF0700 family)
LRLFARDIRLLILAASAGSADGWSYFGLGHAFVANMTGNTVLLGLAVFQNHGDMVHPAIALACYAVGVMLGSILTKGVSSGALWSKAISRTLLLEGLVLLAAEAGWVAFSLHSRYAPSLNSLLATVAMAVGAQSGVMVQLKIPGIVTTYITGTWTTLLSGLVRFKKDTEPKSNREYEHRLAMQASVLGSYFLAAVLSGWLFRHLPLAVGALPALAILLVSASSDGES